MISEDDIKKLGRLARLELTPEEVTRYATQVTAILGRAEQLAAVNVAGIEPLAHVHDVTNVFRPDEVEQSLDLQEVLKNAPDKSGRFFRVPLVVE